MNENEWQKKVAYQAYEMGMELADTVEFRLPNRDEIAYGFTHWQGESGQVYTGQYAMYFEGIDTPYILDKYDIVLVREIEVEPEQNESDTDEITKSHDWHAVTAYQAYYQKHPVKVEYRLPGSDVTVKNFTEWQGESDVIQFAIYLSDDIDKPFILGMYDIVLFREIEPEQDEDETDTDTDEIAKIYISNEQGMYRIKVFQQTIWVERQNPRADNMPFERTLFQNLYDADLPAWNIDTISELIKAYEVDLKWLMQDSN